MKKETSNPIHLLRGGGFNNVKYVGPNTSVSYVGVIFHKTWTTYAISTWDFPLENLAIFCQPAMFKLSTDHPGLAEINAPVGPQEVAGHTLNSQLLIG